MLIHAVTEKGHGYLSAEQAEDKWHSVAKFDVVTGAQVKSKSTAPSYTSVFAKSLIKEAEADDRIVAITAAMPSGTGLNLFGEKFPKRCFDVGIAEQHAVTFAAGLAAEGMKPFAAIYSTFLQRAFDQVVHDVAIQKLPVRFAIDRAGLVGNDGQTHAGSFDVTYLGCLPGFIIMAAADEADLFHMVATCAAIDDAPSAVRYPRGDGIGVPLPERGVPLEIGRGRIMREGTKIALLSLGGRLGECMKAAQELGDLRPLDDGRRCAICQAARHRSDQSAGARARGRHYGRGGGDRRLRQPCAASSRDERDARSRAQDPHDGAARRLPRPRFAAGAIRSGGLNARHIVAMALSALGREIAQQPARA